MSDMMIVSGFDEFIGSIHKCKSHAKGDGLSIEEDFMTI